MSGEGCALWAFRMGYEVDENSHHIVSKKKQLNGENDAENCFIEEDDQILDLDCEDEIEAENDE